jgi:CheY-like chemotaxis protein
LTTAKAIKLKVNSEKRNRSEAPIVIMVSAFSRDELLAQNDIDYVDIVLSKPITPSSLFDAVLTVLDKREPGLSLIHDRLKRDLKISLSGVRVLVVDDSDINREIAQKILMFHGAEVYLANSGQEAIDWLLENPDSTDLVLMDVQMPDMDGYEAARAIRQYPVLVSLPIVALTAGAFTADQETALEAGMDDFIAKPFNVEQLIAVIYRLAKRQSGYKITTDSNSFKPIGFFTDTPNLSNHQDQILPIIDVDEGVNRFGNEEDYFTYLGKFINYYACAGNEISNLIQQGDNDVASALAHKLKGASGNLALKRVTKYTSQIEYSLRTGSPINDTGNLLQQALDQACVAILDLSSQKFDKETEQQYSYNLEGNDPEEITLLLKKLLNALDKDSPSAAEEILLSLKLRLPLDELTKIKTQIAVFDFESAKALTKKLIQKLIIS